MIKIPPYLKPGDTIGITCPASRMDPEAALFAAGVLESWGWKVRLGNTTKTCFHNFSATDEARRSELQQMLDDETVDAVLFGRGGYGLIRLIDQLDFRAFQRRPKWLAGYSDITVLHAHVHRLYGIATLHSLMCSGITPETAHDPYVESLHNALSGRPYAYRFPAHPLNRNGACSGPLAGGNLSLLANLSGTHSQPDMNGKILFIEDVGEYRYSVDRMMYNLKRAGWLTGLKGLLVGAFTAGKETDTAFGQTEYEIILDKVKEYGYPVAFGFPAGHQQENYALKLGLVHELSVGTGGAEVVNHQ